MDKSENNHLGQKLWKLILILWPSWVWKWTLISFLKERRKDFIYPISSTTRTIREGEKEWETYNFLSEKEFKKRIENWDFLEYAFVHNKAYYWLPKQSIIDKIKQWHVLIREIDVQGFDSIKKNLDKKYYASIFILPPSQDILRNRIKQRSSISEKDLDLRMESLRKEIEYSKYANYTVKNIDYGQEEMYDDLLGKIKILTK